MKHEPMTTLTEVLERLRARGLDNEIKLNDANQMQNQKTGAIYKPSDLTVIRNFRFEGFSDPGDNSVIYLLKDKDGEIGYMIDSYGAYSDNEGSRFDDFLKQIKVDDSEYEF